MKAKFFFLLAAALAAFSAPAQAGWVIHEDTVGGNQMVVYIQKNKIFNDTDKMSSLVDLDKGWIHMINKVGKSYWGGPFETFEQEMMAALDKQIDEQMKDMPEDQRQAMKERMKQGMAGPADSGLKIEVVKTGKTAQVAGHDCQEYQVKAGGGGPGGTLDRAGHQNLPGNRPGQDAPAVEPAQNGSRPRRAGLGQGGAGPMGKRLSP